MQGETRSAFSGMPAGRTLGCGGSIGWAGAAAAGPAVVTNPKSKTSGVMKRTIGGSLLCAFSWRSDRLLSRYPAMLAARRLIALIRAQNTRLRPEAGRACPRLYRSIQLFARTLRGSVGACFARDVPRFP